MSTRAVVCGHEYEKRRRPSVTEDSRRADAIVAAKIRRALLSGPECVSKDATVVEMDAHKIEDAREVSAIVGFRATAALWP